MSLSDRIEKTLERWSDKWRDRLRGWLLRSLAEGITKSLEDMEPGAIESFRDALVKVRDNPLTPPEMVKFYNRALIPGNWLTELIAGLTIALGALPALLSAGVPLGNLIMHAQDKELKSYRLDPISVITAWRRDPEKYAYLLDDLREQGWSEDRILALKFYTLFYPAPADLVNWQAREVFEPDMIAKYGLDDELENIQREPFYRGGMTDEQITNYWRAHWEHASWNQVVEMVRRGQLTEDDVWEWFRLVEITPYWRQKLINISWEVPTRVDVRRFWDMRTIDEARLREIYTAQGYHGKDLDDYVIWTKVYTAFPELLARYKNGWITLDDVKRELVGLGMKPERADTMIEEKVKKAAPERTVTEKDITKADIVKGVKTDVITRAQGVELLQDIGYDLDEAVYILEINIPSDEEDKVVTERQLSKTDIKAGIAKEILSREEARAKLLELRYKPADVEFLLDIYEVVAKPPTELKLKEASKADILLGVKKGLITPEEGFGMLLDIDFSPEAADFILFVKAEESPFSPISYNEFKDLTQKWRRSAGIEAKPMTEELKKLGAELIQKGAEVDALRNAIAEEEAKLIPGEELPEAATARLKQLQVALHRAEAELTRVKTNYNAKLAEWRHGARK